MLHREGGTELPDWREIQYGVFTWLPSEPQSMAEHADQLPSCQSKTSSVAAPRAWLGDADGTAEADGTGMVVGKAVAPSLMAFGICNVVGTRLGVGVVGKMDWEADWAGGGAIGGAEGGGPCGAGVKVGRNEGSGVGGGAAADGGGRG